MSVSRRADGRWVVKFRDADGKWKQKSFRDEQTANSFDAEQIGNGQEGEESRLTTGELVLAYLRSRPDLHRSTRRSLLWLLADGGPAAFLRDKYADMLNRQDLERMRENLRARDVTNNTQNHYQAYIQSVLAWGVDQEFISRHPWPFRKLKIVRPMIAATLDDLMRIYQELPDYMQWAVKTAFFLALRFGEVELFSLQWASFDWQRRQVMVRQGKSGKIKTVLLRNEAYFQEAYQRFQDDMRHGITIVCHRNGMRVLSYKTAWNAACRRAGVRMRPYDIRHVAATTMLANGADLAAVAAQLGHSSVATTGAIYAHVTPYGQAHAAEIMPAIDITPLKK